MNERRTSYPFNRKWKALFGFLGISGLTTVVTLFVGGVRAWDKWDTMQKQLTSIQRQNTEFRGRIAELTAAENETRRYMQPPLPPVVHQTILDGEPIVYILPRKPAVTRAAK